MDLQTRHIFGIVLVLSLGPISAYGHNSVEVGEYKIEVGWEIEPPVVGIRNDIVFKITESGENEGTYKGVTSVFKNLEATAMYGGATKKIDINSDPRPGYYFSSIIPTKIGSYNIALNGKIHDTIVDIQIPLEDVESTAVLDFPPETTSSNGNNKGLENSLKFLQKEVNLMKSNSGGLTTDDSDIGMAYNFAVLALSLSVSGVMMGIIAMIRRN